MSRHRNVRSMNYSEEYEGFDDVYGHSVEDDHCISPSDAGFLYDRTRRPQMSAFINENSYIAEEEDQNNVEPKTFHKSDLSEVDIDKLRFCVDEIQNVIGDMAPLSTIEEVALSCNFDVKIALEQILNEAEMRQFSVIEETNAQRPRKPGNRDKGGGDGPEYSFPKFVIPRLKRLEIQRIESGINDLSIGEGTSDSCFSSLKMLMDLHKKENDVNETVKDVEQNVNQNNNPSTLAELSECFLGSKNPSHFQVYSVDEAKTGFIIPKLQNRKSEIPEKWVIDLSSALKPDSSPGETVSHQRESTSDALNFPGIFLEDFSQNRESDGTKIIDVETDLNNTNSSPFGKILCRKWKGRMLMIEKPPAFVHPPRVIPFEFATPSPDDIILTALGRK